MPATDRAPWPAPLLSLLAAVAAAQQAVTATAAPLDLYPQSAAPTSHLRVYSEAGLDPAVMLALETLSGGERIRAALHRCHDAFRQLPRRPTPSAQRVVDLR